MCQSIFINTVACLSLQHYWKRHSNTGDLLWTLRNLKTTFLTEHFWETASVYFKLFKTQCKSTTQKQPLGQCIQNSALECLNLNFNWIFWGLNLTTSHEISIREFPLDILCRRRFSSFDIKKSWQEILTKDAALFCKYQKQPFISV